jgi:hypothetical protein
MMEGVNATMIYRKNFCKCHNVLQYNNNILKKRASKNQRYAKICFLREKQILFPCIRYGSVAISFLETSWHHSAPDEYSSLK